MRSLIGPAAVLTVGLALAGCTTMSVGSYVERGLDTKPYHTYDWGPADALPTGDARLDQDPFFQDYVQGAVEKQLAGKGFARAASGSRADLLIHYHASITQKLDVNRLDRAFGYCLDEECSAKVIDYEAGTLVLDVVDARTNRVIWRGWAQDGVDSMLEHRDVMSRKIEDAVRRMFAQFPRPL